ncbi:MAG: hypothetical protein IMF19_08410 [Proteobacteria bacterium]|nr:hypothetical protein [Pseudomonadota bacterium]
MFIPRDPVNENMFCQYIATTSSGGTGEFLAYAGAVVYICDASCDATNGSDTETYVKASTGTEAHFGFLEQSIKTGYHSIHPAGYIMDKDFGMSHVVAQPTFAAGTRTVNGTKATPAGVAHLGIWETTHYNNGGVAIKSGAAMYVKAGSAGHICITSNGTQVAWCMKGVTAAKEVKNVAGTTLHPIRIKLLI